jgi:cysteine synthase
MNGNVDVLFSGLGSGGTLAGIGRFLKERNPNIKFRRRAKKCLGSFRP